MAQRGAETSTERGDEIRQTETEICAEVAQRGAETSTERANGAHREGGEEGTEICAETHREELREVQKGGDKAKRERDIHREGGEEGTEVCTEMAQ